jgi:hypothetical protein
MQQSRQPRPFDVEALADHRLGLAWIGLDNKQHGILCRAKFHRLQGHHEVLKYPNLQPAQEITKMIVELTQIELVMGRCLPVASWLYRGLLLVSYGLLPHLPAPPPHITTSLT